MHLRSLYILCTIVFSGSVGPNNCLFLQEIEGLPSPLHLVLVVVVRGVDVRTA